jgi:hypothetical protein
MHRSKRRTSTVLAAASAAALLVGPLAGMGRAATDGVGTATVSSTVIGVQLGANGDVLSLRVLGDEGLSSIDPTKGASSSASTLRPLLIGSKTVPALALASPEVKTSSSGAEDKKSVEPALPTSSVFSGAVNAVLSSIVDATGARSGLQAGLANLRLAGGLVNVPTGAVQVTTDAARGSSTATRTITIPDVRVLDLAAVLDGLGLKLTDLSVNQVLALLKSLGATIQGIADPAGAVTQLNNAVDTLTAQTGALTAALCTTVDGLLSGPLGGVTGLVDGVLDDVQTTVGGVTGTLPVVGDAPLPPALAPVIAPIANVPVIGNLLGGVSTQDVQAAALPLGFSCSNLLGTTVQQLLDEVHKDLATLLDSLLATVASTPLLHVTDVKIGLTATAAETVEKSVASVTGSIGSVKVGTLAVPGVSGLDLAAPAAQLTQATAAIQGAVNGVLAAVNASLANIVKVEVLKVDKSVTNADGYTNANAAVTAVKATLTPPATPLSASALLDLGGTPISSLLQTISATVPTLTPLMGQLEASLGGIQALSAPAEITIGTLASTAAFRPGAGGGSTQVAAPSGSPTGTPSGELPRTGGNALLPLAAALTLGACSLGMRRVVRSAKVNA